MTACRSSVEIKDENDTAAFETLSAQTVKAAEKQTNKLHAYHDELAKCSKEIPIELENSVQEQIDSLKRTSANLKYSLQMTIAMEDELHARLIDGKKSVERKWYLPNPPANASIDLHEREKRHFARGMNIYKILLILFVGSFVGVLVELLWCYLNHGYFESRSGLVYGPFNLLYGVGAVALSVLLYRYRNRGKWLSFAGGMIIGSVVEYLCSWLMEVVFGSKSWDYSNIPFNINGRICLLYSVFWGVLGVLWIKDIYPRMAKWILRIPVRSGKVITWIVTIFLIVNCIISGAAVMRWSERQHGIPADNAVRQILDQRFTDDRMERIYANMEFD